METLTTEQVIALEKQIIAEGWTRQFTTFAHRVQEYVELYQAQGFEIRIEPWAISPEADPSCGDCALMGIMRTVFTRKKAS